MQKCNILNPNFSYTPAPLIEIDKNIKMDKIS